MGIWSHYTSKVYSTISWCNVKVKGYEFGKAISCRSDHLCPFLALVSQSAVHHQLVDAYQKAITRYYQQLVTVLPIEDMMEDLMKGKIISHRQQVMIDSKHARAGKKRYKGVTT